MGFWFLMYSLVIILPIATFILGFIFYYKVSKNMNAKICYKTELSNKNETTWEFAHKLLGKIWIICGASLFVVFSIPMLCVIKQSDTVIGILGSILASCTLFPLIFSFAPIEDILKDNFDSRGRRKIKKSKKEKNKNNK